MIEIPKLHPACEAWPPMPEQELAELAGDIAENGLREAIVLMPDGQLLDGRNRWLACERVRAVPITRIFGGESSDGDDPIRFVLSKNQHRRHMSYAERCFAAEALANLAAGGDRGNQHVGGKSSKELLPTKEVPVTREEAAKRLGISTAGIADARVIRKVGGAELVAKVKRGELPVRETATRMRAQQKASKAARPQPRKLAHILAERAARAAAIPELTLEQKGYPPSELAGQQHPEAPAGTTYAMKWREDNGRVQLWPQAEKHRIQLTRRYQDAIGQLARLNPAEWPTASEIDNLDAKQRELVLFSLRKVLPRIMPRLREWEAACVPAQGFLAEMT